MHVLEHPPTERDDEPGVLGQRNELAGQHEPELGVVPADERLGRDRLARRDVDDRLVVDDQLVAFERRGAAR